MFVVFIYANVVEMWSEMYQLSPGCAMQSAHSLLLNIAMHSPPLSVCLYLTVSIQFSVFQFVTSTGGGCSLVWSLHVACVCIPFSRNYDQCDWWLIIQLL